jgi:predicted methyltransferase MtxX (methanogen marker protein 4)
MKILDKFILKIKNKQAKIGIGLGDSKYQNNKILKSINEFLIHNKSNISLFGLKHIINLIKNSKDFKNYNNNVLLIESEDPSKDLISYLINGKLTAIIRGALDSHNFLNEVKNQFNI